MPIYKSKIVSGTSTQGYKLHRWIYHSNTTDKWEIAGLLFLSSEVKEKVEVGMAFLKHSLTLLGLNVEGSLIFFLDKDFDYISVLEELFPNCLVFLCAIHVYRYFKDKVLTGKSRWDKGTFLCGGDKDTLLKQLKLV